MTSARRPRGPVAVTTALSMAVTAALTGCAQDPMPFDPLAAQAWERRADGQARTDRLRPLPTSQQTPYVPGASATRPIVREQTRAGLNGPPVKLSLQEIIHRSVANNLDIRVASYDTAIDQTRILEAEANFDPQFFSDISFERVDKQVGGGNAFVVRPGINQDLNRETQNGQSIFTAVISREDEEALTNFDYGIRQNLASGGKIELKQTVANDWFYPPRSIYNPYYENDLALSLSQPLLQNFGVAINEARITIARNTSRISLLDFRKTVEETVLKVEQAYWELVQTQRDLETQRRLVAASETTAELLFNQQRLGQPVTAAELNQANADTEFRRVNLVQLEARIGTLSDQLKQLMNDPAFPVSSSGVITPADNFMEQPLHFNLDDLVETALENRYELGEQQVRIDSAEIAVDVARNGLLPSLTAQVTTNFDGLSRTLQGAFNNENNFNHVGFSAGLQLQVPIGNRAARAVWQRSLMQRLQAIAGYGSEVEKVTQDVKEATRQVQSAWERLSVARNADLGYQKLLASLDQEVKSGNQPLTYEYIFNLLQNQERKAGVEQAEHQAQNDYNYAIAQLEQAKGTILRYNNVLMEQEQLPVDLRLAGQPDPRPITPGYPYPDRVRGPLSPE